MSGVAAAVMLLGVSLGAEAFADSGPRQAPEVTGEHWFNTQPMRLADLRGRVVLVEFWTFACANCRHVEPYVKAWHERYAGDGLVVLGVHTPELSIERDVHEVGRYVREHELTYPIVTDNAFETWRRYGNEAWPAMYLIDKRGRIRYVTIGEGAYERTDQMIRTLLSE